MEPTNTTDLFDLSIDEQSRNYLREASRWGKFLSILGFIACGLMLIMGLFFGSLFASMMSGIEGSPFGSSGGVFMGVYFTIIALISFFPALYLFNFSTRIQKALLRNDQPVLIDAFKNLKSLFKFYGIAAIIILSLYLLVIIAAVAGSLMGHRG